MSKSRVTRTPEFGVQVTRDTLIILINIKLLLEV